MVGKGDNIFHVEGSNIEMKIAQYLSQSDLVNTSHIQHQGGSLSLYNQSLGSYLTPGVVQCGQKKGSPDPSNLLGGLILR